MAEDAKPRRLYQVWKGSNRFFCRGRLIFGPDVASVSLSTLLITGPAIAFCTRAHSKMEDHPYALPALIGGFILAVLDLIFLFLSSARDPGIVPRNSKPPESDDAFDATTPSMEWVNGRTPHMKLPRTKDVIVNGHAVKVKYCDTCLLFRRPRASHCSICNNCVQRFDHHCPWVGQCIGIRNYRFFFMFISTSTVLCIYVFAFSWIDLLQLKRVKNSLWKAMSDDYLSDFLIIYCFIAVWFVGGLTVFHSYLICTNQTTYENFRYRYDKKENPYNRGVMGNLREVFFSDIPPSMNNFRAFVEVEEQDAVGVVTPNFGEGILSSKEKIDIEMGMKLAEDGGFTLPEILRDLEYDEYDDSDDDLKNKEEDGGRVDSIFPVEQDMKEPTETTIDGDQVTCSGQKARERAYSSSALEDDHIATEKKDDTSGSNQTAAP
ncbi:hypothetical protein BT93_K1191 [Corymbia citriodora subsp. variegata]|nr:hypothetical protein BT93_K1191 [Corymbia citriodora subsp. variegata]KAF8007112.1 hypothetical protein BT93_K1191 [Corymbia citriodora subsp. variegata]